MVLPVNIDSTYADDGTDASVALHQQHHDEIHAAVNNQGMTKIAEHVVATTEAFSFTSIPSIYRHLKVIYAVRGNITSSWDHRKLFAQINADTGANYQSMLTRANGTTVSVVSEVSSNALMVGHTPTSFGTTAGLQGAGEFTILNYATTGFYRHIISQCVSAITEDTAAAYYNESGSGIWQNTAAAITALTLFPATGGFVAGSVCSLYGIK